MLIDNTSTELKDPESIALESNIVVVLDLARKPGLALTGSQNSLVTNVFLPEEAKGVVASRDFTVMVSPLHRFISEHLAPCSEAEMALIAYEGSGERDLLRQQKRVNIAVHNAGMWTGLLTLSVRHNILQNTNVDLIRILSPRRWEVNQYEAIMPSSDHTRFHEEIARGSHGFPIGQLPMIRPDQYTMSLSEDNPRFDILFQSSGVSEHVPIMVDSRQKDWANMFLTRNSSTHVEGSISQALSSKGLEFPIVAKTSEAATGGSGVKIIDGLDALTMEVDRRIKNHDAFILQESLPGIEEFTIHFVAHYGRLLAAECFHSVFNEKNNKKTGATGSFYIKGSASVGADIPANKGRGWLGCNNETLALRLVERVTTGSLYNGNGCMQYKKSPATGKVKIIELNPRVCGGIMKEK
jgi:carbamoylphosphate synthase large subunit